MSVHASRAWLTGTCGKGSQKVIATNGADNASGENSQCKVLGDI